MSVDLDNIEIMEYVVIQAPNNNAPLLMYTVPDGSYVRPIIISTYHSFTGNMDYWMLGYGGPALTKYGVVLDPKMNKDTYHTLYIGNLINAWWKPGWTVLTTRSSVTVAGEIFYYMMYEEWSALTESKEDKATTVVRTKKPAWWRETRLKLPWEK